MGASLEDPAAPLGARNAMSQQFISAQVLKGTRSGIPRGWIVLGLAAASWGLAGGVVSGFVALATVTFG